MSDRRFIEETFPVKEVSSESAREKNIRHGHISTLHIWWARRPLAASRATAYATLVPTPEDHVEREKRRQFIAELCKWENSLDPHLLERARRDILDAHAQRLTEECGETVTVEDIEAGRAPRPRVLDPFAGGGAIPLEALRLGCEVHASDYNPVAVLILKATLEYPQKYGRAFEGTPEHLLKIGNLGNSKGSLLEENKQALMHLSYSGDDGIDADRDFNPLLEAVKFWGDRVLQEAQAELKEFYPVGSDGALPVCYIWARSIPCQNPACGAEIPLIRQFWLAKKKDWKIALHPLVRDNQVDFEIVARGPKRMGDDEVPQRYAAWPKGFDPSKGTVARAVANCLVCGSVVEGKTTRRLFMERQSNQRLVVVVLNKEDEIGKQYRLPTQEEITTFRSAESALVKKRDLLAQEWGMEPVPDEPISETPSNTMGGTNRVLNYNIRLWGDLFNPRQQLALITFVEKVRKAHARMLLGQIPGISEPPLSSYPEDFARAVATYLAIAVDRLVDFGSTLCVLNPTGGRGVVHTFGRQALPMTWDYAESNPLYPRAAGWPTACEKNEKWIRHASQVGLAPLVVSSSSATRLLHSDGYFDAVLTDPPYYDNVPYSFLSDFFYVWLKRSLWEIHPDLFATPLTPKTEEIVAYAERDGVRIDGKRFFEENLARAFLQIHRLLKSEGMAVIVYAHKSTEGWETVVNALLDSGLVVSGAWPLDTEKKGRLLAQATASLASSIYIVARKLARQPTGFYNEVREALRRHLEVKLDTLWAEGIGGADFFIAAIGSAIEVFGRYERVIDYEGEQVRAARLLEDVRTLATDFAVRRILRDGFVQEVSDLTRFYVLWRWNFGEARAHFDEARKLAQSCGIDLTQEWGQSGSFVQKQREYVRVVGPRRRDLKELADSHELIDALHLAVSLWEKNQQTEMIEALAASGFGGREVFYRVAQAIAESLPQQSKEKRLLEGFLAGRQRVQSEVGEVLQQGKLFD